MAKCVFYCSQSEWWTNVTNIQSLSDRPESTAYHVLLITFDQSLFWKAAEVTPEKLNWMSYIVDVESKSIQLSICERITRDNLWIYELMNLWIRPNSFLLNVFRFDIQNSVINRKNDDLHSDMIRWRQLWQQIHVINWQVIPTHKC